MYGKIFFTIFAQIFCTMDKEDLAKEISRLRRKSGLSRYKLSKLAGITITHIRMIEEGELSPRIDTACSILNALDHEITIKPKDKC